MILSDKDIRAAIAAGTIEVTSQDGLHGQVIGPSSYDIRLGKFFKIYKHAHLAVLDPVKSESFEGVTETIEIVDGQPFIVQPGEFVLGVTMEKVKLPDNIVARVEGRSSLGRLGIIIHSTAGFIDPGFEGTITLEITNINRMPVALYPGMRIGQFAFETMTSAAEVPYNKKTCSKYMNQYMPEESRVTMDPEFRRGVKTGVEENKTEEIIIEI
ncbi:MAG: dCTP deaminase [Candidatus Peregrinibacteria bacterium]|nr:dCTP deaminase [Candidatus Peregrinibacteria bacterium]MDZ4245100.1 dCTP deaminase [Candidatus Gracilibacteria bacterium]